MTETGTEIFDELFVDKTELNLEVLKEALSGRVKLTKDGSVIMDSDMPVKNKILLHLLAQKVFVLKGVRETEELGPAEISKQTGMAPGTVGRTLRELADDHFLNDNKGKYSVPDYAIPKVRKLFQLEKPEDKT